MADKTAEEQRRDPLRQGPAPNVRNQVAADGDWREWSAGPNRASSLLPGAEQQAGGGNEEEQSGRPSSGVQGKKSLRYAPARSRTSGHRGDTTTTRPTGSGGRPAVPATGAEEPRDSFQRISWVPFRILGRTHPWQAGQAQLRALQTLREIRLRRGRAVPSAGRGEWGDVVAASSAELTAPTGADAASRDTVSTRSPGCGWVGDAAARKADAGVKRAFGGSGRQKQKARRKVRAVQGSFNHR